ncbi:MAG: glycosyltransferase family 4 protein [Proteobacteria bacterium]|nr:glycosyltransferase family 4 protein [Pseudomonadota bacterium]
MNVGFDISQTGRGKAGCGYFAAAMIDALLRIPDARRYTLFTDFGDFYFDPDVRCSIPRVAAARAVAGPRHPTRAAAHEFWCTPGLDRRLCGLDVVHANNFWCPDHLASARLVYTLYDLGFLADPDWTTEANRAGCFAGVFRAAQRADAIVAISEASRTHFLATFPHYPAERVSVVYPASRYALAPPDVVAPRVALDLGGVPFFLCVGTLEPRKNQRALVAAYAEYRARGGPRIALVFAGGDGWLMEGFADEVAAHPFAPDVRFTGYVSDAELGWLYTHCIANVYVSRFEGFGLPVLEGMAYGAPTICANNTSLPEVGGDAAWYVDAGDVAAIAAALLGVVADPQRRAAMSAQSRARAAHFDWGASASALAAVYDDAVRRPPLALA